jgi:hypothetical protein
MSRNCPTQRLFDPDEPRPVAIAVGGAALKECGVDAVRKMPVLSGGRADAGGDSAYPRNPRFIFWHPRLVPAFFRKME